jgi:WD40 repeat protein
MANFTHFEFRLSGGLSPTSRSGDVVSVHFDEDTATLFTTTAGDRAVRMWDLTELKDVQTRSGKSGLIGSVPTKMKSKRMSFFGGQDTSTILSAELEIECLDIIKPGKSLKGVLDSFSSFSPLYHPRFVDKTYVASNKGRYAFVIQSMDAATSAAFMNKSSFGSYYSGRAGSSAGGSVVSSENSHSELASVQQAGEGTSRLYILNEVLVPLLLGNYVSER